MKILLYAFCFFFSFAFGQLNPQNGTVDSKANYYALKNATIVVSPTKTIQNGTLLIKNDEIVDAGMLVIIPEGAIEIDCSGKIILPGFIELNSSIGLPNPVQPSFSFRPQLESAKAGAYYWNDAVHPEVQADALFSIDSKANNELKKYGFCSAITHINDGIFQGTGSLVGLGNESVHQQILSAKAAQFISFNKGVSHQTYPSSQMGSIALIRQVYYDALWYETSEKTPINLSLEAIISSKETPSIFYTDDKWEILRAAKIGKEFGKTFSFIGSGNEYMALDELKKLGSTIVLPLNFPAAYDVKDPYVNRQIPLSDLKHWELAPSNPYFLQENNIPFCFTSSGLKSSDDFWKNMRKAMERGLTMDKALEALTTNPAKILKVENTLGTLEKGKKASFTIYSENPFEKEAVLLESWILGNQEVHQSISSHDISGRYNILIDGKQYPIEISPEGTSWTGKIQVIKSANDPKNPAKKDSLSPKMFVQLVGDDITIQFNINDDNFNGSVNLHGKVRTKFGVFEGDGTIPSGKWIQWSAIRNDKLDAKKENAATTIDTTYSDRIWSPNMAYGFENDPTAETIVFRNATVWTNEAQGILHDATVIVSNGKISFVGTGNFMIPGGAKVIDAKGKHITSGIIDEHSHIAISKGVNEGGQAISAEVSIADVVNPDDINVYRQLSGGVTAAQLLHGSANPIGGQSALIKLKWGHTPEEFLIANAPKFIKCALGENVKQANWGDFNTVRFPQTRMGVEQVFYDGFLRAKAYEEQMNLFNSGKSTLTTAPRKDLELEVLLEILKGQRFITCHSYVQSEINMLMHVADSMGFKINTFTHILEGYKVADKMKEHGVGASTFSDWWAYKFEVNDAIPYNAKMMADQGLTVAINSDDAEMGRRLNQEAAKAVKYGGMSEEEAWKMVTLNPAKLLHLDDRMGSLKAGKDADIVLWTNNPLSIDAKVEMTLVDGEVLFDSVRDYQMRLDNQREKARLVSKMLASNEKGEPTKPFFKRKKRHFHCDTIGEEGSEGENSH